MLQLGNPCWLSAGMGAGLWPRAPWTDPPCGLGFLASGGGGVWLVRLVTGGSLRAAEVRGLEAGARHLLHPAVGAPSITGCLLVPRESERSVRTGEGARAPWRGVWSVSEQGLRWRWGEPFPRPPPRPRAAPLGHWWPLGARAPGTCVLAWTLARAALAGPTPSGSGVAASRSDLVGASALPARSPGALCLSFGSFSEPAGVLTGALSPRDL